jgi:hypothetical protein
MWCQQELARYAWHTVEIIVSCELLAGGLGYRLKPWLSKAKAPEEKGGDGYLTSARFQVVYGGSGSSCKSWVWGSATSLERRRGSLRRPQRWQVALRPWWDQSGGLDDVWLAQLWGFRKETMARLSIYMLAAHRPGYALGLKSSWTWLPFLHAHAPRDKLRDALGV